MREDFDGFGQLFPETTPSCGVSDVRNFDCFGKEEDWIDVVEHNWVVLVVLREPMDRCNSNASNY